MKDDVTTPSLFKDPGNIELVLRLLQLLCEGHNLVLQDYLRMQPDNIRSLDLIAETVEYLAIVVRELKSSNMPLAIQTMSTLVEFAQGCKGNQSDIFDEHVVESINKILRSSVKYQEDPSIHPAIWAQLELNGAELILAMLEDNDASVRQMAHELEETLDIEEVFKTIAFYHNTTALKADEEWEEQLTDAHKEALEEMGEPPSAMDVGYAWFNVLARLTDFTFNDYCTNCATWCKSASSSERVRLKSAYNFFKAEDLTIEIVRNGGLRKIHFRGHEWSRYLRPEIKSALQWSLDRSSPSDKIRDFVKKSQMIIGDMKYERHIADNKAWARFLISGKVIWGYGLLGVTAILNIMIVAVWKGNDSDFNDWRPYDLPWWFEGAFNSLGVIHIVFSSFVFVAYILVHPIKWTKLFEGTFIEDRGWMSRSDDTRTFASPIDTGVLYHAALLALSVLSLFFYGYFYCFHLFHVVVDNDILLRVMQAITKNGKSLLWVAFILLIVIYCYTLVAFAFYRKSFDKDEGAFCQSMGECLVSSIRMGLMSGGGLGEALPIEDIFGPAEVERRTWFDLSFFILVTVIGMNIVFGIIVDTFSELRDEKQKIEEAMTTECFICSIKAFEFERFTEGFEHHVKHEHCMWNYLFFMLYLEEKDYTDLNSNEQYVYNELKNENENAVFPLSKAMSLEKRVDMVRNTINLARFNTCVPCFFPVTCISL